jgi:cytochrome c-type biogenesis protein CcmH/NrfG
VPCALALAGVLAGCAGDGARDAPVEARTGTAPPHAAGVATRPVAPGMAGGGAEPAGARRAAPAVRALVMQADREAAAGRPGVAAVHLERALRVEPRNPGVWSRLAAARLAQGQPAEALGLAQRSNALAAGDDAIRAQNWNLMAEAYRRLGNADAAADAARRAARLRGDRTS